MDENEKLTLIRKDHKFGDNNYVLGRISGIAHMIRNRKKGYAIVGIDKGHIYRGLFTPEEYEEFKMIVNDLYPGLCEFDYKDKKDIKNYPKRSGKYPWGTEESE